MTPLAIGNQSFNGNGGFFSGASGALINVPGLPGVGINIQVDNEAEGLFNQSFNGNGGQGGSAEGVTVLDIPVPVAVGGAGGLGLNIQIGNEADGFFNQSGQRQWRRRR